MRRLCVCAVLWYARCADGAICTVSSDVVPERPAGQWERIHARELRLSVAHPPANAWEEMVAWTEQGKLWHLPVNNEQGTTTETRH